jgi:carbon monoxide dehydrogenase subunit G
MQIASQFSVPAPKDAVWDALLDPAVLLESIPGCEDLEAVDETHFRARLVTSIAHIQFAAAIEATITERVAPERLTALIEGEDTLLGSALRVDAALFLADAQVAETMVSYTLNVALRGRLGRLGEPIFRRKSRDMEAEFARRFRARLKAATTAGGVSK